MAVVDLYKVIWHSNRHNAANTRQEISYVVAASGSGSSALGSTIQTANGDGKNVTVDEVSVIQKGILQ